MKLLGRKNKKFFIFHSSFFIYFVSLHPQKLSLTSVSPIIYL